MHLFYTPDISGNTYTLSEEESKHAIKVLRLQPGGNVQLIDGKGSFYTAEITEAHPKKCQLKIIDQQQEVGKRPFYIHIAVAPTKNPDRIEWFVEKAVEIGIDEITFLQCDRSERKVLKPDRIEKIAVSAIKQSLKAYMPQINELVSFKEFLNTVNPAETFIAHLEEDNLQSLKQVVKSGGRYCILIGPEGDFSPAEIEAAYKAGIKPVTLGESRLRTETAALVACHTIHVMQSVLK